MLASGMEHRYRIGKQLVSGHNGSRRLNVAKTEPSPTTRRVEPKRSDTNDSVTCFIPSILTWRIASCEVSARFRQQLKRGSLTTTAHQVRPSDGTAFTFLRPRSFHLLKTVWPSRRRLNRTTSGRHFHNKTTRAKTAVLKLRVLIRFILKKKSA